MRKSYKSELELKLFLEMIEGRMPLWLVFRLGIRSFFDPFKMILLYLPGPIGYKIRQAYYKFKFKYFGKNSLVDIGVIVTGAENISIGEYTWIDSYVRLDAILGDIIIGKRIHIAQGCILVGGGGLILEDYVGLSPGVKIYSNSESPKDGKRMSGPMVPERYKAFKRAPVIIKKDAFLGSNAVILPGVTIGEGAVIGANSLIAENIPAYSIAIGVPARIVGKRDKITMPDL